MSRDIASWTRFSVDNGREDEIRMKRIGNRQVGAGASRRSSKWGIALMVVLMSLPVVWGCPPDVQTETPQRDRDGDDEVGLDIDVDDFAEFEEVDEYSRPDYPVRRNPFRPDSDVLAVEDDEETDDDLRPTEPLERYALSALDLVTIISETTVPKAMFVDPSGLGHFAKEGDRIGENDGVIRTIRSNEVEVQEGGQTGTILTVEMRERDPVASSQDDGLTEAERETLRRLLESEEGREALEGEFAGDESAQQRDDTGDERFPGLLPPERD